MKSIKEKQFLVNLAVSLGQEVDPNLAKEIAQFNSIKKDAHESIKKTALKDLAEAFKQAKLEDEGKQLIEYPLPPTVDEVLNLLKEEIPNELVQPQTEEESAFREETTNTAPEPTLAERAAKIISEAPKRDSFQQPDPDPVAKNFDAVQKKLKFLEQAIGKIAAHGPGSGEVKLRFLDDIDRNTISSNLYLVYDQNIQKFTFDMGHRNNFYGQFQSNVSQYYVSNSNVAAVFTYNITDYDVNVSTLDQSNIILRYPGTYNLQYSVQFENPVVAVDTIAVWLRKNNVDIEGTSSYFDIPGKHAGANGRTIGSINFLVNTRVANETVSLAWHSENATGYALYIPTRAKTNTEPFVPGAASIITTITPVKIDSN